MADLMMRMAGRGADGLAKAIQTDKDGNVITKMGGSQSTLIKEHIGDTSLLTSQIRSFGVTTGASTIGVTPFDVSDSRGREFFVNNRYDADITIDFWAFKSSGETTPLTRIGVVHSDTVKAGEQKTIDSTNLNGRYLGLVAFVQRAGTPTKGSMDMLLFGSSDVNVHKLEKPDAGVDIINLVENYRDITKAYQFIESGNGNFIRVGGDVAKKYETVDIVVTNTTSTPFRLSVRPARFGSEPTIRLANGDYSEFSTSLSDSTSQIVIPENCTALNVSQIPITRIGDGMEAYDPHIWQKYRGTLDIFMRAINANSSGYVSVWLIGYK